MIRTDIAQETAEALLYDLVALPSPSRQETEAARYLVSWMAQHGYNESFVDTAGNAVGIIGHGQREIVLLGHIDTFSGSIPARIAGRTLYGRGAVDAKGSLCTFAAAAPQAHLREDVRVIVIGAVEEEVSSKGARFAAEQYRPQMCIIGEPSQWDRITLGYKGRLLLRWRWQGGLAHSASSVLSAPEQAFAYWQRISAYTADLNKGRSVFERLDATIQQINSGQQDVDGWSEMLIGFRLPPGIDPCTLVAQLPSPADGAQVEAFGHERAFVAEKDSELSRALRSAIRACGGQPRFVHKTGTSDMNIVAPIWGCPVVAYGPGDSAYDHTPEEQLDLDEYARAVAVLATALGQL